jgi:two-component system, OmpR family, alkaline phosphatase synthesis response regulator PhoP
LATAENRLEALIIAKHQRLRLILLDMMIPPMDGYEVYKEITKDIKIVNETN